MKHRGLCELAIVGVVLSMHRPPSHPLIGAACCRCGDLWLSTAQSRLAHRRRLKRPACLRAQLLRQASEGARSNAHPVFFYASCPSLQLPLLLLHLSTQLQTKHAHISTNFYFFHRPALIPARRFFHPFQSPERTLRTPFSSSHLATLRAVVDIKPLSSPHFRIALLTPDKTCHSIYLLI
jgi:hypothetical protein